MKLLDVLTDYLDFVYFLLFPYFIIINKINGMHLCVSL